MDIVIACALFFFIALALSVSCVFFGIWIAKGLIWLISGMDYHRIPRRPPVPYVHPPSFECEKASYHVERDGANGGHSQR